MSPDSTDVPDDIPTTRFRGPQQFPVPGRWVLTTVEGDGIHWVFHPRADPQLEHRDEAIEQFEDADTVRAGLLAEMRPEHPDGGIYLFHIDGTDICQFDMGDERIYKAVGIMLKRFDRGADPGELRTIAHVAGGVARNE
jgi:hypothetical protein